MNYAKCGVVEAFWVETDFRQEYLFIRRGERRSLASSKLGLENFIENLINVRLLIIILYSAEWKAYEGGSIPPLWNIFFTFKRFPKTYLF